MAGALEGEDARAGGEEPAEQRGAEDEEEPRGHRQPKGRDHDYREDDNCAYNEEESKGLLQL